MTKLRRYAESACDGPFGSAITSDHYVDEGARVVRLGNIGSAEWLDDDAAYLDLDYWKSLSRHHTRSGDLVVAALGDDRNPVGRAAVIPDIAPALVKADCHRVALRPHAEARFLAYFLSSDRGRYEAGRMADGSTRKRLTIGKTLSLPVPEIPVNKQQAIADFLDAETARIDALITKKRRMIELLGERKASTMLAAVSGRLSPSGFFVSSALEWLDERPQHWGEVLLRLVARPGSGHTPSRERPEWWVDPNIPWITTGEVAQVRSDEQEEIHETRENISELGLANSAAVLHPEGTVVLCRTASAGYSAIMGREMATSQDFATWTCGPMLRPRFLLLCLRAMRSDLLGRLATGSTHKTIYMPDIHALRVPLPPVEEQDAVVVLASERLTQGFQAVRALRQQIELLQEHRQALITAAVTGELDVPGAAAA